MRNRTPFQRFVILLLITNSLVCCSKSLEENGQDQFVSFSVIGDSISSLKGFQPARFPSFYPAKYSIQYQETWWGQLELKLGWRLLSNASWSASTVSGPIGSESCFYSNERIKTLFASGIPDYIFIMGGINDWIYNVSLLNPDDKSDPLTFEGAYRTLLNRLLSFSPNLLVVCCSILPTRDGDGVTNASGWTIQAGNEVLRGICQEYGAIYVDFSNIWEGNEDLFLIDRIHPNISGMSLISDCIVKTLLNEIDS